MCRPGPSSSTSPAGCPHKSGDGSGCSAALCATPVDGEAAVRAAQGRAHGIGSPSSARPAGGPRSGCRPASNGSGPLSASWSATTNPRGLSGNWQYASATVSDAVLLPAALGALPRLVQSLPSTAADERLAARGAFSGGLGGTGVQCSWWSDPQALPNWTRPKRGAVSLPGWYHPVFVLAASTGALTLFFTAGPRPRPQTCRSSPPHQSRCRALRRLLVLVLVDSMPTGTRSRRW